jgi:DNA sulfur modification protein DndC
VSTLVGDVYLTSTDPWVVAYSGGKDSSVVLDLFMKAAERHRDAPHIYVVSNNTRVESPLVIDHLKSMHGLIQRHIDKCGLNMSVHMTEPPLNDSFWVNLIGKGYPTPNQMFRWCTSRLKIDPTSAFLDRAIGSKPTVIAVGTRSAESSTRKQKIEKYAISEFFSTHTTRKNTDLFMPIRHLSDDDVWEYLASVSPPWGGDYFDLINLYREAYGGECPVVADASTLSQPSCGERSPRFGCWTCTLVKNDSSLQGLIDTGYEELKPLYDFRNWLIETRDQPENRLPISRQGKIRYRNGRLILGPYRIPYRKRILRRLRGLQQRMDTELITECEIRKICDLWERDRRFLEFYFGNTVQRSLTSDEGSVVI